MSMSEFGSLVIVGLGPGKPDQVTREAWAVLEAADEIFVRTERHPTVGEIRKLLPSLQVRSFDHLYVSHSTFDEAYRAIVDELLAQARLRNVVYCVPGSPLIGESTVEIIRVQAAKQQVAVRIVHGLSYVEPVLAAVEPSSQTWLCLVDAVELDILAAANALGELPGGESMVPVMAALPSAPLLVSQVYDRHVAAAVKLWLGKFWPDEHEISVIRAAGTETQLVARIPLHELDRGSFDHLTSVYVPALDPVEDVRSFTGLLNVTLALRAPGGCPWDREQTHASLKPYLVEEAYEVIEALDEEDSE